MARPVSPSTPCCKRCGNVNGWELQVFLVEACHFRWKPRLSLLLCHHNRFSMATASWIGWCIELHRMWTSPKRIGARRMGIGCWRWGVYFNAGFHFVVKIFYFSCVASRTVLCTRCFRMKKPPEPRAYRPRTVIQSVIGGGGGIIRRIIREDRL